MEPAAWWPLALLCAAQFCLVLNFQVVSIALPAIGRGMNLSASGLQWVVSANALAFGGLLLLAGRLADLFGPRRIFLYGLGLFAAASLGCALAIAPAQIIAARAGQGAGAALTAAASLALLTAVYEEGPERTRALGFWGASGPLGGAAGILLGGGTAAAFGWRAIFALMAPVALAPVLLAPGRLPVTGRQRRPARAELDLAGAVAAVETCVALVYGCTAAATATTSGFGLAAAMVSLVFAAVLGGALVVIERRADFPLFSLADLRRRPMPGAALVSLLFAAVTNTPIFFYALFLQAIEGRSPFTAGLLFIPCDLAVITGAALGARLTGVIGARLATVVGMSLNAVGMLLMARLPVEYGYQSAFLPGFVIEGLGSGVTQVAVIAAGTAGVPERSRGFASGVLSGTAQVGTALGLALLVGVASVGQPRAVADPSITSLPGFRHALLTGAGLAATGAVVAFVALGRWETPSKASRDCRVHKWKCAGRPETLVQDAHNPPPVLDHDAR